MPSQQVLSPPPPSLEERVLRTTSADVRREVRIRRGPTPLPPGSLRPSAGNTHATLARPLELLIGHRERFGDVFTIRTLHEPVVWALGAPATHQMLVSEFDAFSWREGRMRDLHPILGDGMLNIDGSYHRELRKVMLPAFHREQVDTLTHIMIEEGIAAADALEPGVVVDIAAWARPLALRIAMRALLGMPPGSSREQQIAAAFERALGLYGHHFAVQALRGPGTPFGRAMTARRALDQLVLHELHERRRRSDPGAGVLGLLLATTTADGAGLPDAAIRDQVVTLLFAGHDTTTATLTFLLHELSLAPAARTAVEDELATVLAGAAPAAQHLDGKALPVLERTLDETLRRWPPAWVGPRRSTRDVVLAGTPVPANVSVHYSSWATHHLPDLWPDPFAFDPDRFLPQRAKGRPLGAYVPFGAGSRMCLGKRFGQVELRALAAVLLQRHRFAAVPGAALRVTTTPTLGPKGGLQLRVSAQH